MQTGLGATDEIPLSLGADQAAATEVRLALEAIVASQPFRTSKQCQNLLRYIVDRSLSRDDLALRERVLGVQVFGRAADYDTSEDPVVRMRAADVRKRLAQYYQSIDDEASALHIELKPGSYRATFHLGRSPHAAVAPDQMPAPPESRAERLPEETVPPDPVSLISPSPARPTGFPATASQPRSALAPARRLWPPRLWLLFPAVFVAAAVGIAIWYFASSNWASPQRRFWAPLTAARKPVLLYLGSNVAYRFTPEFQARYQKEHGLTQNGPEFFVDLPPNGTVQTSDLTPVPGTFVTVGDLAASTQVVCLLNGWGKPFILRSAEDLSIGDLRNTPAVLIGGFNNRWSLETTEDLRFSLRDGTDIRDREHPDRDWKMGREGVGGTGEDYAVISRLLQSKTGGPAMIVSGIGSYGTQAAAEFVSSEEKMSAMLRDAPRGWERKNFQMVLHIRVVAYTPVAVEVVTTAWW